MSKETEQDYYERCEKLSGDVDRLRAELEQVKRERDHWKANHDNRVEAARVLIERDDLPLERINAYKNYVAALELKQKIDAMEPVAWMVQPEYEVMLGEATSCVFSVLNVQPNVSATPLFDLKGIKS